MAFRRGVPKAARLNFTLGLTQMPHAPAPPQESILAGRLMMLMAGKVTEGLSKFASWLVGSFTAVLAFLLANLDTVSKFMPATTLGFAGKLLVGALAIHVIQRYLALLVAGSVASAKEAESLAFPEGLNMNSVMRQIESSTFWPARILVRNNFAKLQNGDFAAPGRMMATLTQIQGLLVVSQLVLVLYAGYTIVGAL